jgi:hypothetical protein
MEPQVTKASGEIEFHFEKSRYFRVIHADGAFGGVAPGNRNIHLAIFSERSPLPRTITHRVADGLLGEEIIERRETKQGIFREVEADLVMTVEVAVAIRDWLDQRINESLQASQLLAGDQK